MKITFKQSVDVLKKIDEGLLLVKTNKPKYQGAYVKGGERVDADSMAMRGIDLQNIVFEKDLVIDELGETYLDGEPFEGTSIIEKDNILLELTTFKEQEITKNVRYNLDEELVYFSEQNFNTGAFLEYEFLNGAVKLVQYTDEEGHSFSLGFKDNRLNSLSFANTDLVSELNRVEEVIKGVSKTENLTGSRFFESLRLRKAACDIQLLGLFESGSVHSLTIENADLTLEKAIEIIEYLSPKTVDFVNVRIDQDSFFSLLGILRSRSITASYS